MNIKKIQTIVNVFWAVLTMVVFYFDTNGTIQLISNTPLFVTYIIAMVGSFIVLSVLEKKYGVSEDEK